MPLLLSMGSILFVIAVAERYRLAFFFLQSSIVLLLFHELLLFWRSYIVSILEDRIVTFGLLLLTDTWFSLLLFGIHEIIKLVSVGVRLKSHGRMPFLSSIPSPVQVVVQLRGMYLMIGATIKSSGWTGCRKNTN